MSTAEEFDREDPPEPSTNLYAVERDGRVDIRPIQGGTPDEWIDVSDQMLFRLEDLR